MAESIFLTVCFCIRVFVCVCIYDWWRAYSKLRWACWGRFFQQSLIPVIKCQLSLPTPHPRNTVAAVYIKHAHTQMLIHTYCMSTWAHTNKSHPSLCWDRSSKNSSFRSCQVATSCPSSLSWSQTGFIPFYREVDRGLRGRSGEQTEEEYVTQSERIDIETCWALQLPLETPFAVGTGLPRLRADVWISFSKVGSFGMLSLRERENCTTVIVAPLLLSKNPVSTSTAWILWQRVLISQLHSKLKEELKVIGLKRWTYSIWLCLKCSILFFFEKNKINKVRYPLVHVTWFIYLLWRAHETFHL